MRPVYCVVCKHIVTKNPISTNRGVAHKLCAWNRQYAKKMAGKRKAS